MNQREFKHLPGPYRLTEEDFGDDDCIIGPYEIKDANKRLVVAGDGGLFTYEPGIGKETLYANARLLTASFDLCAILAEIEAEILQHLPDVDQVIAMRKRVKELLDSIEKGGVSE